MKKILFVLLVIPNLITANNRETHQEINQRISPAVRPTLPQPSIKERFSQKAATIAKLSQNLDNLSWKKLAIIPLVGTVIGGVVGGWLGILLMPRIILKGGLFGGIAATGVVAIIGAAKLGNMIVRKSFIETKKTVPLVKEKPSSSSKKQ